MKRKNEAKAMFGSHKVLKKEKKNIKRNGFLIFNFVMENINETQI